VRFANGLAQSISVGRHSDQMDVIGPQAVSPDVNTVLPAPMRHQIYIGLIVPIKEESLLPAVASLGDMMRIAGYNDPCHEMDHRMFGQKISIIMYGVLPLEK
jgi:hypothetical protein